MFNALKWLIVLRLLNEIIRFYGWMIGNEVKKREKRKRRERILLFSATTSYFLPPVAAIVAQFSYMSKA